MPQQTHTGFQSIVNAQPAPAQAGDFAGVNPRAVVIGAPGALQAPAGGLIVGNIAWADLTTNKVSQSYDVNGVAGFLHREEQAIIVTYLGISTYVVNGGFPVTLFSQGDFWGLFAAGAQPRQQVYADPVTGALIAGTAGTPPADLSVTASIGASFTGVVAANVLTTSAVTGYLSAGDIVTGAGVAGVALGAQLTGPAGGAGTYTFVHADVGAEAMTSTSTVLDVTAITTGVPGPGDVLTGAGVTAGTQIVAQLTGAPGAIGLYSISVAQGPIAGEVMAGAAIATPWYVKSVAAAGEVAKISTWGK